MTKEQGRHRQQLELIVINGDNRRANTGQWIAASLGFLAIAGGLALIAFGKDTTGLVAIIGALGSLAGVFVTGSLIRRGERKQKQQGAPGRR